jgi:hypothetical protein
MHDRSDDNRIRPEGYNTTEGRSKGNTFNEHGGESFLDAGLQAIARGCKIFPCNGKKQPLTPHGCKDASSDEEQVRVWAAMYPGGLWGHALAKETVVLDLDVKNGKNGPREFEKQEGVRRQMI